MVSVSREGSVTAFSLKGANYSAARKVSAPSYSAQWLPTGVKVTD